MSYENAPATKMLATNCCCCGRPLVDSMSVELGIGPECRGGATGGGEGFLVFLSRLAQLNPQVNQAWRQAVPAAVDLSRALWQPIVE